MTRSVLEVLAREKGVSVVIITKSALITRDVDLLASLANRSQLTIHLSLITLDRELARRIEPRAPTPEARVRALERLAAANNDVGINIMPVLPGIIDRPAMLDAVVRRVKAAGASHINACALRLRSTARRRYLPFIELEFPRLASAFRIAYTGRDQMGDAYRGGLSRFIRARCRKHGITYGSRRGDGSGSPPADEPEVRETDQLALSLSSELRVSSSLWQVDDVQPREEPHAESPSRATAVAVARDTLSIELDPQQRTGIADQNRHEMAVQGQLARQVEYRAIDELDNRRVRVKRVVNGGKCSGHTLEVARVQPAEEPRARAVLAGPPHRLRRGVWWGNLRCPRALHRPGTATAR